MSNLDDYVAPKGFLGGGAGGSGHLNNSFLLQGQESFMLAGNASVASGSATHGSLPPQWYRGRSLAVLGALNRTGQGGMGGTSNSGMCGFFGTGGNGLVIIEALDAGSKPTMAPTGRPSGQPSGQPSHLPTSAPSTRPTPKPSVLPTPSPSTEPSPMPSPPPTTGPSPVPTGQPSGNPTSAPTAQPFAAPTSHPSKHPTPHPSPRPTSTPTPKPSSHPTPRPTAVPSPKPTWIPTVKISFAGMRVQLTLQANTQLFAMQPYGYDDTNTSAYSLAIAEALQESLMLSGLDLQQGDIQGLVMSPRTTKVEGQKRALCLTQEAVASASPLPSNPSSSPSRLPPLCGAACNALDITFNIDIYSAGITFTALQVAMTSCYTNTQLYGLLVNHLHDSGCRYNASGLTQVGSVNALKILNLHPSPPPVKDSVFNLFIQTSTAYIYMGTGVGAVALGAFVFKARTTLNTVLPMLGKTKLSDCLLSLVLSIMLGCSNTLQVLSGIGRKDYIIWCLILSIRFVVMMVAGYIIVSMLFRPFLNKMLIPEALHNSALWCACSAVMLLDPTLVRLLPWRRTEFTNRSGGYPNFFVFRLTLVCSIFNSAAMATISSILCDFSNLRDVSNSAPFFLSIFSLGFTSSTFVFKLLAERLFELNPTIDSKEDIDFRAEELRKQEQLLQEITSAIASQKVILEAKRVSVLAQDREWLLQEQERIRAALDIHPHETPSGPKSQNLSSNSKTSFAGGTNPNPNPNLSSNSKTSFAGGTDGIELAAMQRPTVGRASAYSSWERPGLDNDDDDNDRLTFARLQSEFREVLQHEDRETIDVARANDVLRLLEANPVFQRNLERQSVSRRSSVSPGPEAAASAGGDLWGWGPLLRGPNPNLWGWGPLLRRLSWRRLETSASHATAVVNPMVDNPIAGQRSSTNIIPFSGANEDSNARFPSLPTTRRTVDFIPDAQEERSSRI